ncbi:MAG TPA: hypothetical protein VLK82_12070 [Candidatus Tectomicrobia bacterium]|nr:hypothetical protein [Candidatus Tectomicrobia bacterium]
MALIIVFLLDPLVIALLQSIVALSGDPYPGNAALIAFLLSPVGPLTVVTTAVTFIFLAAFEFGGVSQIAWDGMRGQRFRLWSVWTRLSQRLPALLAAVVIGVAFAAHWRWLSDADIYFHLTTRSTEFVLAVAVVAVTAVGAAVAMFWWGLRWFLSVPICMLRSLPAITTLRMSAQAVRGRRRVLSLGLRAWLGGTLALSTFAAIALAGLPRSIWEVRYEDIAHLDIGSWFDPRFSDERIPTLRAFSAAACCGSSTSSRFQARAMGGAGSRRPSGSCWRRRRRRAAFSICLPPTRSMPAEALGLLRPEALGLATTEHLAPLAGIIGQPRALSALDFGLHIQELGFHIYVAGPPGMGKMTALQAFLEERARGETPPPIGAM